MLNIIPINRNQVSHLNERCAQSSEEKKSPLTGFVSSVNNCRFCARMLRQSSEKVNDFTSYPDVVTALGSFIRFPSQNDVFSKLISEMYRKDLPPDFASASMSEDMGSIKSLLGMLATEIKKRNDINEIKRNIKDVPDADREILDCNKKNLDDDKKILDGICTTLVKAGGDNEKERDVVKKLRGLLARHGQESLNSHINDLLEMCRLAWKEHHKFYANTLNDNTIFSESLLGTHNMFSYSISQLLSTNPSIDDIAQYGDFFNDACKSILLTLNHKDSPASEPRTAEPNKVELADAQVTESRGINIHLAGGSSNAMINGDSSSMPNTPEHDLASIAIKLSDVLLAQQGRQPDASSVKSDERIVKMIEKIIGLIDESTSLKKVQHFLPVLKNVTQIQQPGSADIQEHHFSAQPNLRLAAKSPGSEWANKPLTECEPHSDKSDSIEIDSSKIPKNPPLASSRSAKIVNAIPVSQHARRKIWDEKSELVINSEGFRLSSPSVENTFDGLEVQYDKNTKYPTQISPDHDGKRSDFSASYADYSDIVKEDNITEKKVPDESGTLLFNQKVKYFEEMIRLDSSKAGKKIGRHISPITSSEPSARNVVVSEHRQQDENKKQPHKNSGNSPRIHTTVRSFDLFNRIAIPSKDSTRQFSGDIFADK
ncbi:hypothetical protein [Erwinia piriflorinigrans]|uniref:Uncharacterized protein n=1 Tax=Erwinia piriflorinigrans CFBP 5888 TaxID=1161919 RepID=V5Z5E5_9GAMM|nr:hypothetical protein [Erwinia piriflorinigrans]CCG86240.1 hypothetical protein EPIR_0875 [Erwinia piriflorinigrans CFBP 5888]